ncbi:hypothetical protein [Cloacibacillus evryensis]|uniref:hypothetical protein n=1 Tax=Cloacibacillus evryensis TaxID=508460 RepID=UPI003AB30000
MKRLFLAIVCLMFTAGSAYSCQPGAPKGASDKAAPDHVENEAIALVRVPPEMRSQDERRRLFGELCRKIAAGAGAEVLYISPIYEDSENGIAHMRSADKSAKELIALLKKDKNVIGASPNHITRLSPPIKSSK